MHEIKQAVNYMGPELLSCIEFRAFFMLEKSYLHQNGIELNFLFIEMASGPAISASSINPRIREDSKGVLATTFCKRKEEAKRKS